MAGPTNARTLNDSITEWTIIIAAGVIATGLSQPAVLDLPFRHLLTTTLLAGLTDNDKVQKMSLFFGIAALPWSLKILAGLLLDSVPLFGTRRRNYLLIGPVCASAFWLLLPILRGSFWALALDCMAINIFLVITSTAGGALFAEVGQRLKIVDRLAVVRVFADNTNAVIAGPISGLLATVPFFISTGFGAVVPLVLIPVVFTLLREQPSAKLDSAVVKEGWRAVVAVLSSRQAWAAALLVCVVSAPQSFPSLLYIQQTKALGLHDTTIGLLNSTSGAGAILATILYAAFRSRLILRNWLILGIFCASLDAFLHIFYRSIEMAFIINLLHGLLITVSVLVILEVIGRATPENATALGFAFMASAWNAGIPIGDNVAAFIEKYGQLNFYQVVSIYAAVTPLTLVALKLLPQAILSSNGSSTDVGRA